MDEMKYHRTFHFPYSETISKDDKRLSEIPFIGKEVVVSEKMDGTNVTMTKDYIHARSVDETKLISPFTKKLWGNIRYDIPEHIRICGEDIGYVHSICYKLTEPFYVFSIWENERCLSWKETIRYCELFGLFHVPVFYCGIWDEELIDEYFEKYKTNNLREIEGYVVRLEEGYLYQDSLISIAKFVRKNHVTSNEIWWKKLKYNDIGDK